MNSLTALERAGWDALCDGTGAEFYGSLMTGDAVVVLADGRMLDRDGVVAALENAPPWTSYSLSETRVIPLGTEAAAVLYRARAERPGTDLDALMSSSYVRHEGDWRLALRQLTVIS